jgi:hypothetical protein
MNQSSARHAKNMRRIVKRKIKLGIWSIRIACLLSLLMQAMLGKARMHEGGV